ncbi:2-dehydro-3-deoxygluconokinase [Halomonas sp. S2151]|uniref:sugar kinase n=1 Tax=unclassified Halomonas TaxID=2609666 RepID=UPI0005F9DD13|nr:MULTISPECIES: sugar kinase [unclassified Halomonas]KJZ16646.1 2-dehydro-3-deoxygluconokinase [Halomonas sp. S2151]MBS8267535.1 sugar kinase [Halomonas litopenaei]MBY5943005.1 sugar kinase [Halomonas sp. DP5N14-9]
MNQNTPDILTFGEAMTLFAADAPGDLAEVERFSRSCAGADTNVAIGLSRLGFKVGWLSRVGEDCFGRYLRASLEREGLDCRHLITDAEHATGLVFKERAVGGADPRVEYRRHNSAASKLSPADAQDVDFSTLRHLHATGIPPALSASCRELSQFLLEKARQHGTSVSFDPNLRPTLWASESEMRDTLNGLAAQANWVLPGLSEGQLLTGQTSAHDIAGFYLDQGADAVVIKLGPEGSYYRGTLTGQDEAFTVAGVPVETVVDTVGAGDGFAVGFVSAMLDGLDPRQALKRANLIGAEQVQVPGDMEGLPDRERLDQLEAATAA